MDEEYSLNNRARKVAGRHKRQNYQQGTRAYLHAMTNSVARRAQRKNANSKQTGRRKPEDRATDG